MSDKAAKKDSLPGNTSIAVAVFDFDGDRQDMLRFKAGDILTIVEMNDNGWWKGKSTGGRVGIFPFNYVELEVTDESSFPLAKALYTLAPNEEDEEQLSFDEGELITIIKEVSSEWCIGKRFNGDTGRFPVQYVERTGEENTQLKMQEREKWDRLRKEHLKEQLKVDEEKVALNQKFALEERDEREAKIIEELGSLRLEAAKLRRDNQMHLEEIKRLKAEFIQTQRDLLLQQARARRELDEAKLDLDNLRETLGIEDIVGEDLTEVELDNDSNSPQKNSVVPPISKSSVDKNKAEGANNGAPPMPPLPPSQEESEKRYNTKGKKPFKRFQNLGKGDSCIICGKTVGVFNKVKACGKIYHDHCFRCNSCNKQLPKGDFVDHDNLPYCKVCHRRGFGPKGFGLGLTAPGPVEASKGVDASSKDPAKI